MQKVYEEDRLGRETASNFTEEQQAEKGKTAMAAAKGAKSMEEQKATQAAVLTSMAFVPGFDAYSVALKDVAFYKPYSVYGNQKTIDNRRASNALFGATDAVHNEMVNSQYQLGK